MKPKTLILIVAAVGCGLAASYMTSRLLAERAKERPVEEDKVAVLVARNKLAMGTMIKDPEKLFMQKVFTKGNEPKNALTSYDQVKDKHLNKPLGTEQFVTSEDLLDGTSGDLSAILPAGMRPVAIRANLETSTGFVLPNSRVDLIVTVKKSDSEAFARIFMQNMLVLAVNTQRIRDPEKDAIIPSVVTIAATPDDAETLVMAQSMGEIRLLLRPFGEEQMVNTRGAKPGDVARVRGGDSSAGQEREGADSRVPSSVANLDFPEGQPKPPPPAPQVRDEPPPPRIHTLVIYNGESVTKAVFQTDHHGEATTRDVEKQDVAPRPEKMPAGGEPGRRPGQ